MASTVGFVVILVLYASIGVMGAAGSTAITQRLFRPRWEQVFYAAFLVPITAFYLARTPRGRRSRGRWRCSPRWRWSVRACLWP
jgi:hypothetical protein